jgi:chromosomal replication initiator protein
LNPARFLPLPENRLALAAVERLVESLSTGRSERVPLYLHGPAGSGKSHLVRVLLERLMRRSPGSTASVLAADDLTSASSEQDDEQLAAVGVANYDLWIVEDLQHLRSRQCTYLASVFDRLLAHQVPMVFTATVGPGSLPVPGRLRSRLAGGLVVAIDPLSEPSRRALLLDKAQRRQIAVTHEVLAWLAKKLSTGRQIDGALTRLEILARTQRSSLDLAHTTVHFGEDVSIEPTVEHIANRVGEYFHVELSQLRSPRRSRHVVVPRQVGMYLARQLTRLSLEQIGSYFGGRDHSTVLHACQKVKEALHANPAFSGMVRQLHAGLL